LKLKKSEEHLFLVEDLLSLEGIVGNFFGDDARVQRVNVLILASQVHAHHANRVYMFVTQVLLFVLNRLAKVLVKEHHCKKISSLTTFEAGSYFNHPVYHLCPIVLCYCVSEQW
jgi:hypothetical protein